MDYQNMSQDELIKGLVAKDAALKASATRRLTPKVSEKGAVSMYGMGRFPVTMYGEQWLKVLDMAVVIRQFIDDNKALLAVKPDKAVQG